MHTRTQTHTSTTSLAGWPLDATHVSLPLPLLPLRTGHHILPGKAAAVAAQCARCLPACLQCSLRDREGAEAMSSPPALPTPLLPAAGVCCGHRSFLPQCLLPAAHVHVRSGGAWCASACVGWSTGPIVAASHVEPHTHPSAPPPAACTGFCTSALALPWHASLGCWCCRARQVGQPLASGWRLQHVPSC